MLLLNCLVFSVYFTFGVNSILSQDPEIVTRDEWGARPPTLVENMTNPVPYVVIHHSYIPAACYTKDACIKAMQWMQDLHQLNNSWNDIGYSFAAGGDNRIYMGRGWSAVGAHAPKYNNISIGICIIGDWRESLPPKGQLLVVKELIKKGVREGYIQRDYKLIGHRQVRATECPGDALYAEIQKWPHWTSDTTIPVRVKTTTEILTKGITPDPREAEDNDLPIGNNKLKRHSVDSA